MSNEKKNNYKLICRQWEPKLEEYTGNTVVGMEGNYMNLIRELLNVHSEASKIIIHLPDKVRSITIEVIEDAPLDFQSLIKLLKEAEEKGKMSYGKNTGSHVDLFIKEFIKHHTPHGMFWKHLSWLKNEGFDYYSSDTAHGTKYYIPTRKGVIEMHLTPDDMLIIET